MASPVVEEVIESNLTTAGTSHVVTLPTATSDQLLLIIIANGSTAATYDAHASLTELLDEGVASCLYIAYRWMDGTEPASYTLTSSASTKSAHMAYRISGAENPSTQAPEIGTTGTGTSATPDPPASATPASSKDYLFIACFAKAGEEADDDTWSDSAPTNYTPSPPRQKACGVAGTNLAGILGAAERALTTGSAENPGTFAVDVSTAWRSQTIMVHPAASADVTVTVTAGSITWSGQTVTTALSAPVTAGAATWSGQAVTASMTVPVTAGTVEWQGQTVTISIAQVVLVDAGSITWLGQSLTADLTVAVAAASVTWTGQTVTVQIATVVPVTAGSVTWSGRSVSESITVPIAAASITWTGQTVNVATVVSVVAGSATWSGQTVNVLVPTIIPVTAGAVLWQGQSVTLVIPGAGEPVCDPDAAWTATDADLRQLALGFCDEYLDEYFDTYGLAFCEPGEVRELVTVGTATEICT